MRKRATLRVASDSVRFGSVTYVLGCALFCAGICEEDVASLGLPVHQRPECVSHSNFWILEAVTRHLFIEMLDEVRRLFLRSNFCINERVGYRTVQEVCGV